VTITQTDIKALIAYSSVVHMGMVLSCVLIGRAPAISFALMIIIAHGVCRSGLFYGCTIIYERVSTRCLPVIQGGVVVAPSFRLRWVLLILINLRAPPSLNIISEALIMGSLLSYDILFSLRLGFIVLLVLVYSLVLFYRRSHGDTG
jgi:NADH-ubiquinone oxidoreductase chain 4